MVQQFYFSAGAALVDKDPFYSSEKVIVNLLRALLAERYTCRKLSAQPQGEASKKGNIEKKY